MRTTTLPSMLEILTRNYNFRNKSAKLYELGRVYFPSAATAWPRAQGALSGRLRRRHGLLRPQGRCGGHSGGAADRERHLPGRQRESLLPPRPLRQGLCGGRLLGVLGQIHPHVAANYGVDCRAVLPPSSFRRAARPARAASPCISPCPSSPPSPGTSPWCATRLSPWARWRTPSARELKGLLKERALFDIYTGTGMPEGKKSVAFNLDCAPTTGASPPKRRTRT